MVLEVKIIPNSYLIHINWIKNKKFEPPQWVPNQHEEIFVVTICTCRVNNGQISFSI
jgi:hypothetical protein